jgi:hypothetical protein
MEGLKGILDSTGEALDMAEIRNMLASVGKRVFLVKNIHEKGIQIFHTRWAISYLTGPMAREQIKQLNLDSDPLLDQAGIQQEDRSPPPDVSDQGLLPYPPHPEIPIDSIHEIGARSPAPYYSPRYYLEGEVIFDDHTLGIYIRKKYAASIPISLIVEWKNAEFFDTPPEFSDSPLPGIRGYEPFGITVNYSTLRKIQTSFKDYLYSNKTLNLLINRKLNLVSELDETEKTFQQRCREVMEKTIDKEVEKIKSKYDRRVERIEDKIANEKLRIQNLKTEHKSKTMEEIMSIGETVLGVLLGSKSRRGFSTAARRRRMTSTAASKIKMRKLKLSQLEEDLLDFQEELEDLIADIEDNHYDKADQVEDFEIRLEKDDIIVSKQNILWKLK